MTETTLSVESVDAEIEAARTEVADLERRVVNGDAKVTASMIGKAREKLDFLGLRRKAAEKSEAQRQEDARQRAIDAIKAERLEYLNGEMEPLKDLYEQIVLACGVLAAINDARVEKCNSLNARAFSLGLERQLGQPQSTRSVLEEAINEGMTGLPPRDNGLGRTRTIHTQRRIEEIIYGDKSAMVKHENRVKSAVNELLTRHAKAPES